MKISRQALIYFFFLFIAFIATSCNKSGGKELKELKDGNYALILLQDQEGVFWAIPVINIKSYQGDNLLIKTSSVVAKGVGNERSDIDIVENFIKGDLVLLMKDYKPGEWTRQSFSYPGYASGQLVNIEESTEIMVREVIDKIK